MENMTIGQRIASRRKLANLSQESISEQLGVSRQSVSKWESDAGLPDIDNLIALSKIFGVSVGWLLGTEQDPNFDPSTGLSDAQLRMVEKVVASRRPGRWQGYLSVGLAACVLVSGLAFANSFVRLKGENAEAKQQIASLKEQVTSVDETLLQHKQEGQLLRSVLAWPSFWSEDENYVTLSFQFVPKLFLENQKAYLIIQNKDDYTYIKEECSETAGYIYRCQVELPVASGYSYSFILANDNGFQEQDLNDYALLGCFGDLSATVGYHLYPGIEKRTLWDVKETVYTFDQPIASPTVSSRQAYVGYRAIDVTLYHNDTPIYTESLRQAFRDQYGPYMVGADPLRPDISVKLPKLAEGDLLRLEITTEDYGGQIITNVLEELTVTAAVDKTK